MAETTNPTGHASSERNLLGQQISPYLLQHAANPVHWRPWGRDALDEARERQVPVLLSVGYAACHWCHVMAHEFFEDPATAQVMNRLFVNIKVDREERPDIDHLYMSALHAMGEQGGWPLTMFLSPDGAPFWGGTYFPPTPRWGRPSFRQVLEAVAGAWRDRHDMVRQNAASLSAALRRLGAAPAGNLPGPDDLDRWRRVTSAWSTRSRAACAARRNSPTRRFFGSFGTTTRGPAAPRTRRGRAPAASHGTRRHLRPSRRRLRPLRHRRHMAGAPLREDALRQRATARAAGLRLRRSARPAAGEPRRGDDRLASARHAGRRRCERPSGVRRLRGRRQRGRGRPVLCLERVRDRRSPRRRLSPPSRPPTTSPTAGNWEGRTILRRVAPPLAEHEEASLARSRARLLFARARASASRPRRQGARRLERPCRDRAVPRRRRLPPTRLAAPRGTGFRLCASGNDRQGRTHRPCLAPRADQRGGHAGGPGGDGTSGDRAL